MCVGAVVEEEECGSCLRGIYEFVQQPSRRQGAVGAISAVNHAQAHRGEDK